MVAFCDLAPAVVFSPIAGAVADRMDRVRLTMLAQAAIALQAATVGAADRQRPADHRRCCWCWRWCSGIASCFAQPARQSLMPGLVPRADLPAAVACNSLCFNVARFIGPAIAGPLIAVWRGGAGGAAATAVAYLMATCTMPLLRVDRATQRRGQRRSASALGRGGRRLPLRRRGIPASGRCCGFAAVAVDADARRAGDPAALRRAAVRARRRTGWRC